MGENGWSILEIIVVLILVIALLNRIFGTPVVSDPVLPTVSDGTHLSNTVPSSLDRCDKVLVATPKPLENIKTTVTGINVTASVANCSVVANAPYQFTIVIVDAKAKLVSETVSANVTANKEMQSFSYYVPLTALPVKGTGYVLITRLAPSGEQLTDSGARVPIRFVN